MSRIELSNEKTNQFKILFYIFLLSFISYPGFLQIRIGITLDNWISIILLIPLIVIITKSNLREITSIQVILISYLVVHLFSNFSYEGSQYFIRILFPIVFLIFLQSIDVKFEFLHNIIVKAGLIGVITTLLFYLSSPDLFINRFTNFFSLRDSLLLGNFDEDGMVMTTCFFFFFYYLVLKNYSFEKKDKILIAGLIIISILNMKRVAIGAGAIVFFLFLLNKYLKVKTAFMVIIGIILLIYVYVVALNYNLLNWTYYTYDIKLMGREKLWNNILTHWYDGDLLFGNGLGDTKMFQVSFFGDYLMVHNDHLLLLNDIGVLGWILFFANLLLIKNVFKTQAIFLIIYYLLIALTDNAITYYLLWGSLMIIMIVAVEKKYFNKLEIYK